MVRKRKIVWPELARQQLKSVFYHIRKDSLKNAEKVRKGIIDATNELAEHPLKYASDKHKMNNDGTFRAFELYHYRVAYQATEREIVVVRVRHTSMEPLVY